MALDALNVEVVQPGRRIIFFHQLRPCAADVRQWNFPNEGSNTWLLAVKEEIGGVTQDKHFIVLTIMPVGIF